MKVINIMVIEILQKRSNFDISLLGAPGYMQNLPRPSRRHLLGSKISAGIFPNCLAVDSQKQKLAQ